MVYFSLIIRPPLKTRNFLVCVPQDDSPLNNKRVKFMARSIRETCFIGEAEKEEEKYRENKSIRYDPVKNWQLLDRIGSYIPLFDL